MKENNGVKCQKQSGLLGKVWFNFNCPALEFGFIFLVIGVAGEVTRDYLQGPFFSLEPNHLVEFSNNSGAEVKCSATGSPWPVLQWTNREGRHIQDVTGIRYVTSDGTLVFAPFKPDDYRQDIHAAVYTCVASNKVGSIRSRDVQVRAVIQHQFKPQVYNVVTTKGNTALLQCQVPSFVRQFVSVESWSRSDGVQYRQNHSDDNIRVLQTGEMLIYNVENDNIQYTYMCKAKHRLTGYIATSATYGKPTIQEPHGPSSPRFVLKCSSVKVLEGQQSELPCVTEGWPVPTVRWYKEYNGKLEPLAATERVSVNLGILTIRDTERYDGGLYVCVTNNSVEEKREKTILKVTSRLKVMVIPKVQVVQLGGAAVLNCTINGFPINAITWLKNERPLVVNSRISYLSKTVMKISSVVRSDSGMYQCLIFNNDESGQGTSELTIRDVAPILASSFPETTVHPGTSVSLTCTATANPIPNISWFVDKQPVHDTYRISLSSHLFVEDSVVGQLNLTDTRVEDGGRYTCVSSNGVGSVEHSNRLNVYGPPFIRPMWNMTVVSDHILVLRCPFGGFPVDRITWERGRILLPLSHREEVGEDGTLTIRGVHKQVDEGKYTCTVQNSEGQIASGSTFISVVVAPVIDDNFFPDKVTVTEGMTARIYCSVTEGEPPIRIHWVKDGEILMTKGHVNVDNSQEYSVVVFKHVTARDNGKYTCIASNSAASVNRTTELIVNVPPRWIISPTNKSAVEGRDVYLDCSASGSPRPVMTWIKSKGQNPGDFVYLYSNTRVQIFENGTLLFRNVQESDEGYLLCQATNRIGIGLRQLIFLEVQALPRFDLPYKSETTLKGQDTQLTCFSRGEQPMNIIWKKGNQYVKNYKYGRFVIRETDGDKSKTSTLTILKSTRDDSHIYTCVVTNSFGKDEMNIQLIVQEPPDPPWNLTAVNVTSRSITVHWLNGFSGNSEILRHLVQYKVDKDLWMDSTMQLIISGVESVTSLQNLQPVTTYNIRILAENSQGPSDPSNEIEVTTLEEAPSGVSTEVNVYSAGSQSLKVMWKPVNKTLQNGQIKGYNVGFRKTSSDEPYQIRDIATVTSDSETDGWHTTYLTNLDRQTNYSVVVQAYNKAGFGPMTKEVIASTLETAPPTSPVVKVTGVTATSASFQWNRDPKDKSTITEYIFHFKTTNGEWLKRHLHSSDNSLTLNDLRCGTRYEAYLTASNSLGTGEPSQTIRFRTKDSVPVPPPKDLFLEVHGTSLVLLLTTWQDGGCPIRNFTVLYKPKINHRWYNVSHQVSYGNKKFTIPFLKPGEIYELLVTARGDGGVTQVKYEFQTHRVITTFVASSTVKHKSRALPFHKNLILIVPVVVSAFVVILIIIIVVVCLRKHPTEGRTVHTSGSVRQRGKQSADENVVMGDLSEKLTCTTKTGIERQSYYSSPTRRPILNSHIGTRGRRPDNHEYAEPYASVPPPRRVPVDVTRDYIKDRPNEGTMRSTFSRPEGDIWNDGRSNQPPGLWERYEPSSNSSQSENSNDRTSSQYSGGRRIQV